MSVLNIEDSVLFIIDIQEKLLNASYNKEIIKNKSEILAKTANILKIPCIITEQYPKGLGLTINNISDNLINNKATYYEKTEFNALANPDIKNHIKILEKKQIILAGIETHICVRQTAKALIENGFDVSLIKDACGSRAEAEHIAGLNLIEKEGAFIKTTEIALFELLKSAKHPNFKEIQALIK